MSDTAIIREALAEGLEDSEGPTVTITRALAIRLSALLEAEEESGAPLAFREKDRCETRLETPTGKRCLLVKSHRGDHRYEYAPEPEPEEGEPDNAKRRPTPEVISDHGKALAALEERIEALKERWEVQWRANKRLSNRVAVLEGEAPEPDSEPEPELKPLTDEQKEYFFPGGDAPISPDAIRKATEPERDEGGEDRRSIHDDEVLPKEKEEGRGLVELIVKLHEGGWQVCNKDFAALIVGKELARARLRSRPSEEGVITLDRALVETMYGLHRDAGVSMPDKHGEQHRQIASELWERLELAERTADAEEEADE